MKLKILIHGINFSPEFIGIGKYTSEMVEWLVGRGHEVRVVTAHPYYPQWRVWEGHKTGHYTKEVWKGATVYRVPLWVPRKVSGLNRLLHLASMALSSIPVMLGQIAWRPDIVWLVEPPLMCAPTALLVAKLGSAKTFLHIQDYEVDAAFSMGLLRADMLRMCAARIERWLMRRFDRVSTISGRMVDRAIAKGVDSDKVLLFPNWVDTSAICAGIPSTYRQELGIPSDNLVALYSGNMGAKQGLEILASAASQLNDRRGLSFVFCGEGSGKQSLVDGCSGLTNVHLLGLQPADRLSDLLSTADVHLLPQRADAADLVMPSKLVGMLASARPVVATAAPGTELAQVIQERAQCGLVVPPGDGEALARGILELSEDAARRKQMGLNGRLYVERELDKEIVLRRFESDLLECMETQGGVLPNRGHKS